MAHVAALPSTKQWGIDDWLRMYKSLTDPDEKLKAKLLFERQKRMDDKRSDTGL